MIQGMQVKVTYHWLQKGHIPKPMTLLSTSKDTIKNDSKETQTISSLFHWTKAVPHKVLNSAFLLRSTGQDTQSLAKN